MKKAILILAILFLSCSEGGLMGEDIVTYDFKAYVETTIQDIRTDSGKVIHTRVSERLIKEEYNVTYEGLEYLKNKFPEGTITDNVVHDGNLTIRTIRKTYHKIISR